MRYLRRKSVADAIAEPVDEAAYSATDLLHRRTPLAHRFRVAMGATHLEIETNSPQMGQAICPFQAWETIHGQSACAKWEIEVEVRAEEETCFSPMDAESFDEMHSFGPSRSFRMEDGSWFAHTPPSMDGVGFVFVTGDECHQVRKLKSYLDLVHRFVVGADVEGFRAEGDEVAA